MNQGQVLRHSDGRLTGRKRADGLWRCLRCNEYKPESEFGFKRGRTPYPRCQACRREMYHENPAPRIAAAKRYARLRDGLGNTELSEQLLMVFQDGRCAICAREFGDKGTLRPVLDHDHDRREIRGLLCGRCNMGIGLMEDDADLLLRSAEYLRLYRAAHERDEARALLPQGRDGQDSG